MAKVDPLRKIVKGCLQNRKEDQYRLYARFSRKMFGICLRYAASHDEAQDILQEGFIKVFYKLPTFKWQGNLEAWIRRIFVNTAIEKYRERVYHLPAEEVIDYEGYASRNHGPDILHTRDILAFVQQLPLQYRLVFNLYAIEGYSHREIGELLQIAESTSRSNLARARLLLKDKLESELKLIVKAI